MSEEPTLSSPSVQTTPGRKAAKQPLRSAEFKMQCVRLLEEGTRSASQLASELGVSHQTLRNWRQRYGAAGAVNLSKTTGKQVTTPRLHTSTRCPIPLAAEVARLQRELRAVTTQRDILKKAISIFGSGVLNSSK